MPFDIGIGLILGVILSNVFDVGLIVSLIIGVSASLLPDIDFILKYARSRKIPDTTHRDGLHYPLIVVPIFGVFGLLVSPIIGLFISIGLIIHFIHDSIGIGFGVKWLYPFKNNSYLFLFQIKTPTNANMPKRRLYSWNDEERGEMIKKYGYKDWIKYVYFKPNPYGMFEYATLLTGIIVVLIN